MLQPGSAEQMAVAACAALLGAFAGGYAWRTALRYGAGLRAGADPDARLMLKAAGGGALRMGDVAGVAGIRGLPAAGGLAAAYGWLCLQPLTITQSAALMLFLFILLSLACIDACCGLLPDALTLPLLLAGLAVAGAEAGLVDLPESVFSAVLAYGLLLGLAWVFRSLRGRDGLGGGDVKCIAAIAAWSGFQGLFVILLTSSLLGVAYALAAGRGGLSRSYPFGPCLALAVMAWLVVRLA
ncbi:leader peptidase (prepilin peptidase)/N-methyltransferase [Paracandidimonas soli]|uniref:Leader peptidase (Prepilin peptidase)/N-methyltransferase n=3 Tax=Paracandidimonas soli TaxID=1917182 RepID=A0A4R3V6I6_9BURK|nr:leader peptidase (prepilin peptidase)/N-methyltransferase [Paracandidimonas soli]